jgi:hypothetical protein
MRGLENPKQAFFLAVLFALSLWNSGWALRHYWHWPVWSEDEWTRMDRALVHARVVLNSLPDRKIEYRTEEASDTYDQAAYFRLQYILAPAILRHEPVDDRFVLVEFLSTKRVKPLSGLTLVEDFGNGLALFRRPD